MKTFGNISYELTASPSVTFSNELTGGEAIPGFSCQRRYVDKFSIGDSLLAGISVDHFEAFEHMGLPFSSYMRNCLLVAGSVVFCLEEIGWNRSRRD